MSAKKLEITHPFAVDVAKERYSNSRFETLNEAEDYARMLAYRYGTDYAVYKQVAIALKPEHVNSVKIEAAD